MREEYTELIIGYLQNNLNNKETDFFYQWIDQNPENKKLFFEVKMIYDACFVVQNKNMDTEKSWNALLLKKNKKVKTISLWQKVGTYAAVAVISIVLTSILFINSSNVGEIVTASYMGGDGLEADVVILPDGTRVSLGSKTIFRCEPNYGKTQRSVYLDGEAYFEVAKEKSNPFIVKVNGQEIEALGTKFNVTAYAADSMITTTLLEGSVRLATERISEKTILLPNQQFTLNKNSLAMHVSDVDADQFVSWTTGYYYFPEQSLKTILHRLSNLYGVHFTVNSERLNNRKFTGTLYRGQRIEDILEIINLSIPIKFKIDDHHITISELTK